MKQCLGHTAASYRLSRDFASLQNRREIGHMYWRGMKGAISIQIVFVVFTTTVNQIGGLAFANSFMNMFGKGVAPSVAAAKTIVAATQLSAWDDLGRLAKSTATGQRMEAELILREKGEGPSHQDAKVRLFGTTAEPRVTYYRDTAAWCPYCQKVWILLEEKKIPYKVEKIAMRSYGDKPASYLKLVPNGLLPAINIDGDFMTDSLQIMLTLERTFKAPQHLAMWPAKGDFPVDIRKHKLSCPDF